MDSILFYDLIFLTFFCIWVIFFLYKNRANLKREMSFAFLYRAQWGVKSIKYIGNKFRSILGPLRYLIIAWGYVLMAGIIFLISRSVYIYVAHAKEITSIVKAPPISPVIPYFPQLFGMESFFPPFPFISFLISLSIVAIVHEFSHGIYMVYSKIKIKSTGIVFFGPLLGAFVEQDETDMKKASKINQMATLGAGVFANTLTAIIFFLIWMGLFYATFVPVGATFNTYAATNLPFSEITQIGNIDITELEYNQISDSINNLSNDLVLGTNGNILEFTKVSTRHGDYYTTQGIIQAQLESNSQTLYLYYDLPGIKNGLRGTIIKLNEFKINEYNDLGMALENLSPGEEITLTTIYNNTELIYTFDLGENPNSQGSPMIGIGNTISQDTNMAEQLAFFKNPYTEYQVSNTFLEFLYYLVFWIFLINILVAFFNMLPFTILDGGAFFHLTIWGITKSKKTADKIYKLVGWIILFGFLAIMVSYFFGLLA